MYMNQKQCLEIHKAKTDRAERKNGYINNYSWDFNASFSAIVRTARQKISKNIYLNNIVNQ